MRSCKKIEKMILIYTKAEIIPEWVKELKKLRYLYVLTPVVGQ
uniref:Uncharacterized protein n=1 Tax=Globisporangium ultimum (strain ATCC 200006 / CBS 805.95 / DAOM BR144) TaxID=431595 RepID=K3WCA1_GLOUD